MRKCIFALCLLFATLFGVSASVEAQLSVLSADFEQGMPSGWTVDPATVATPWSVSSTGISGVAAYGGTNYLSLVTTNQQAATKLVLPIQNIASLTAPELSFYLVQKARGVNAGYARDTLRVYARTSTTAAWTLVQTFSSELTTWTRRFVDLTQFGNAQLQVAFEFVFGSGLGLGIDNVRLGDATLCFTPNNLQAYRVKATSAELMWNAYEAAYMYNLKVSSTPLTDPASQTADAFDQAVFYKPYQVTGLTPSTTYYFYVSAACGEGDDSSWSPAGSFTTGCAPIALPYTEDIEASGSFLSCWTRQFEANGDWGTTTPAAATYLPGTNATRHAGSLSARLYAYYAEGALEPRTTRAYIATQEINTTDIRLEQVTFWGYSSTVVGKLHVGVMTDPSDFSTFEEMAVVSVAAANTWAEYTVPFNAATNPQAKYICFVADGNDGNAQPFYFYVDDVLVETAPPCPKASMLRADVVTDTHARISWMGNATAWDVKASTTSIDPDQATGDVFNGTVNVNSVTLNNLTTKTSYYVYVRANCTAAGNGTGEWSSQYTFRTTGLPAVPPFFTGFEDATDNNAWDIYNGTLANKWCIGSAAHHGGANALYISNDNGTTNAYTVTSTTSVFAARTVMLPPGTHCISFDWQCNGESSADYLRADLLNIDATITPGTSQVGTALACPHGTGRTLNTSKLNLANGWQHFEGDVTVTDTTLYQLTFYWRNDASSGNLPPAAIDNVSIQTYACTSPSVLNIGQTTSSSVVLSWTPGSETQWQVQLLNNVGTLVVDTVVNTPFVVLNDLAAGLAHTARVRGRCSATDFGWWMTRNFRTLCDDIRVLPYRDNFQSYGTGSTSTPTCWTVVTQYSTYPYISTINYNHTPNSTGTGALTFTATSTVSNLVALPKLNVPGKTIQDVQMTFYMLKAAAPAHSITVGVMTDPTDRTTFVPVQTFSPKVQSSVSNPQWELVEMDFSSYTGNGAYIAFWDGSRSASNTIYIDDLEISLLPSCPRPTGVELLDVSDTEATFGFNLNPLATDFEAAVVAAGDPLTASNIVATGISTTNTIKVSGLSANTSYDCYIRSICGGGDTSTWSVVVPFTTTRLLAPLPYTTDFSNPTDNAGWVLENGTYTNRWITGTGADANGALYVSNNNSDYVFTPSSSSYIYAYKTFRFNPGVYRISFDWEAQGYSSYNVLRAFLVPTNVQLTAGNAFGMTTTTNTDPAGWISLSGANTKMNLQASWTNLSYDLTVEDTVTYNLVFFWRNTIGSGSTQPAAIDNVSVLPVTCAVEVEQDIHDTYNIMNFRPAQGTPAGYEVVVNNTPINLTDLSGVMHHVTTTNAYDSIGGLTPNTPYYAYVRSFCGSNDTGLWMVADFRTECLLISVFPHTWNFEDAPATGNGTSPDCWTRVSGGASYPNVSNSRSYNGGGKSLYFYSTSANAEPNIFAMPRLGVQNINEYKVEFYTYYTSTGHGIAVGVMTDVNDPTTFVPVDTVFVTEANSWQKQTVRLRDYTGNGKNIAFLTDRGIRSNGCYVWVDDVTVMEDRFCNPVENVYIANVTGDGAQISWSQGDAFTFNVMVTTKAVNPDTVAGTESFVMLYEEELTDNSLDLRGMLTSNVTYYFYVQGDCHSADNKPSLWTSGTSFTTVCSAYALPYAQSFSVPQPGEGMAPTCWFTLLETLGSASETSGYHVAPYSYVSAHIHSSTDSCALRMPFYRSTTAQTRGYAILPELTGSLAGYKMDFYMQSSLSGGRTTMLVGTMTDVLDASTFVAFDTVVVTDTWSHYAVALDNVQNLAGTHLAIVSDGERSTESGYIYVDDFSVVPTTSCSAPSNIRVESVDATSVDVFVTTASAADQMVQIQVARQNITPDSLDLHANIVEIDTVVNVSNLPVRISGLAGMTTYYVYARVVCDAANNVYSPRCPQAGSFTTSCSRVSIPYDYGFDNGPWFGAPQCWTVYQVDGTHAPYIEMGGANSTTYALIFNGTASNPAFAVMPETEADSIKRLVLTYQGLKGGGWLNFTGLSVGVMTDPLDPTTYTEVFNNNPGSWTNLEVAFNNYTGTGRYIAFKSTSAQYIDEVHLEYAPTCHRPSTPTQTANSGTTITASWNHGQDNEGAWDVVVLPEGTTPLEETVPTVTVSSPTATLTGLQPNTNYSVYVRAVCAADDRSEWEGAVMHTACLAYQLDSVTPFVETFDNDGTGSSARPSCWIIPGNYPYLNASKFNSGIASLYFYSTSSGNYTAATPELAGANLNELELTFKGLATNSGFKLEVGVMENPDDVNSFVSLSTIGVSSTNTWEDKKVRFTSYSGNARHIAFRSKGVFTGITNSFYIDDVNISILPPCSAPGITFTEVNSDTMSVEIMPVRATDSQWQYVVTAVSTADAPDMAAAIYNRILTTTSDIFTGFSYNTHYSVYARTVCGNDSTPWERYEIVSPCGPVVVDANNSFYEDFDTYGAGNTVHVPCWTNHTSNATAYPYVYASQHKNGSACLYSYDNGSQHTYIATPRLIGSPVQQMQLDFWGRTTNANYKLEVGVMTDPEDYNTFQRVAIISCATANQWYEQHVTFGDYTGNGQYIAFKHNNAGYFMIDSVFVSALAGCHAPGVSVHVNSFESATATVIPGNEADTNFIFVLTPASTLTEPDVNAIVKTDTLTTTVYDLQGLSAATAYTLYTRVSCGDEWTLTDFTTHCAPVIVNDTMTYNESFDSYGTGFTVTPDCWLTYTNGDNINPYITSTNNTAPGALYFSPAAGNYSYATTPQIDGTPANEWRVQFTGRKPIAGNFLEVGVMSNPDDQSTFVVIDTIEPVDVNTWVDYTIDFVNYSGTGKYLAFRAPVTSAANYFYLDNVVVSKMPSCAAPTVTAAANNGNLELTLVPTNTNNTQWEVVVDYSATTPDIDNALYHQVVNNTSVIIPGASASVTYFIHVRSNCGDEWSDWGITSIVMPCGLVRLPYAESLSTQPTRCWETKSGLLADVMAGTSTLTATTGEWMYGAAGTGLATTHTRVNVSGTSCHKWLISPQVFVDTFAVMEFDLGLGTALFNFNIDTLGQQDDRFVVLASRDGGNTWSDVVAEWNNSGSANIYNRIAYNGSHVSLPIIDFVGDTVTFAFYVESTVNDGNCDLHLGNINIHAVNNRVDLADNVCDGYNYTLNGFNIQASEINLATSPNQFTRLSGDTLYVLSLSVTPSSVVEINDTIADTALPYTLNGFNVTAAGSYQRFLNTVDGCDSIVTLNLVVLATVTDTVNVTICDSDLPYTWNGNSYTAAGTYTYNTVTTLGGDSIVTLVLTVNSSFAGNDTISVCDTDLPYTWNGQSLTAAGSYIFNGTTAVGCDSVVTLEFIVNASYAGTETLDLLDTELPYMWNGQEITAAGEYTYNGTTAEGCDSVITLTVNVTVGLDYAEDGMFAITPNPVERGGNVRIDANVNENSIVEVFTSNGKLVSSSEYGVESIYVTMPQVAGLYMVRLTTESGRMMYGKVIVK